MSAELVRNEWENFITHKKLGVKTNLIHIKKEEISWPNLIFFTPVPFYSLPKKIECS